MINIKRSPLNPIIRPGTHPWRQVASFNPGVICENGHFFLYERAAASLRPLTCSVGLWESLDGESFSLKVDHPILTPADLKLPNGTIEDPRVVKIDQHYYMTFAYRPYTFNCFPTGYRIPDYTALVGTIDGPENNTMSGIAVSDDLVHFTYVSTINPSQHCDDRDVILFPGKIKGRFAILERPKDFVDKKSGLDKPSIWIAYSDDLKSWTKPTLIATPRYAWEGSKIGAGAPPIKTEMGWLLIYHAVDDADTYRVGAMLLDLENPSKVLYRTKTFLMEPTEYYEKYGLIIPNVIFPTGAVIHNGLLHIYYGCCDTAIGLATVPIKELLNYLIKEGEHFE